jgi:predicted SAM-dependent methyltransferase
VIITLIIKGILTYIPGLYELIPREASRTISARYYYSVWLRHLTMAHKNHLSTKPNVVAELGPGDSLGIGLAALLSGANKYYALDVIEYASKKRDLKILDELVDLFLKRENIPNEAEFPRLRPFLESYDFPGHILTEELLNETLKPNRIEYIRNSIINLNNLGKPNIQIFYFVPWYNPKVVEENSVDMIYSQAVLEHIDDLAYTYEVLYRWLKPGGFMSHHIDFKCHRTAKEWNGHWAYSDFIWKLIKGKRPYFINRHPHSTHLKFLRKSGFELLFDSKSKNTSGVQRKHLASKFKNMSDEDLTTSDAFIQAIKK